MRRHCFCILSFLCIALSLQAVETIVVGTVIDILTGMPIENASVYYKGTSIGCATNEEGVFMIRTNLEKRRTLVVSAIGYKQQTFHIEAGQSVGIQVELQERQTVLEDVFIRPGANPALPLMERVRAQRQVNDFSLTNGEIELEENKHLFVSDIQRKHLERALWRSLKTGMITAEDSTLLLPLYTSKSKFRYQQGKMQLIGQPQQKSVVLTESNYSILLQDGNTPLNFYRNTLSLHGVNFISPLASSGNAHYTYYLADSVVVADSTKSYILHFRSKNPFEPSFNGEMVIDSLTCALQMIDASVPKEVSVNYLRSVRVQQHYTNEHILQDETVSSIFDFAIKADTSHFFPTVLLQRQSVLSAVNQLPVNTKPLVADSTETLFTATLDSLENLPIVKWAQFFAHIIYTGNVPTNTCVDIGNITELINYTRHEGLHLGIPVTTNERFSRYVELSGYIGYGFRDRAAKGKGQIRVKLPSENRHIIGASYWDHYVWSDISTMDYLMHENSIFYGDQDFTHLLLGGIWYNRQTTTSATRRRELRLWTENEWKKGVETQFDVKLGRMGYGSPYVGYFQIPSYRFATLQAALRLSWGERNVDMFMKRYHVHSRYPVVRLMAEMGSWRLDNMEQQRLYGRLSMMVQQTVPLGMCGKLDYMAQAGIILGRVPYPFLEHFIGNQSYTYDPYRFTLMDTYQYAADKYVFAHLHWNMQGAIFNRIPGIRYLHLRELVELKVAYGTLSSKHGEVIPLPESIKPMKMPYVEAGIGIGNILRIADLYAVFRLTNLKDTQTPWWGIRARFSLGL